MKRRLIICNSFLLKKITFKKNYFVFVSAIKIFKRVTCGTRAISSPSLLYDIENKKIIIINK